MTIQPDPLSKSIIRTCKANAFHPHDTIELLRSVLAEWFELETKYIYGDTVYRHVWRAWTDCVSAYEVHRFITDIFHWTETITCEQLTRMIIGEILNLKVYDGDTVLIDLEVDSPC